MKPSRAAELLGDLVGEDAARRRERDHRSSEVGCRLDGRDDGFGPQHHPRTAAKGRVVDAAVHVASSRRESRGRTAPTTPALAGPPEHRRRGVARDRPRGTASARRPAASFEEPLGRVDLDAAVRLDRGRRRSAARAPRVSSTIRSLAGLASTSTTTPRRTPPRVDDFGAEELVDPDNAVVLDARRRQDHAAPPVGLVARARCPRRSR